MKVNKVPTELLRDGHLKGAFTTGQTNLSAINDWLLNPSDLETDPKIYNVQVADNDIEEGQPGGLFFGISRIAPGDVHGEFYFTKGHFHKKIDTGEYYWGISGSGLLLLGDTDGNERLLAVEPGAVLYIPGKTAHRLINIGQKTLAVGAVWQSESGHAYSKNGNLFKTHVLKDASSVGYKVIQDQ